MEHRTRLWKKRSSEKISHVSGESDLSLVENGQESDKELELERSLKDLNEELSYARTESNVKDSLLAKQARVAEEAIAGWEKAGAETVSFKQDLDEALLQRHAAEERIINLDASLKEYLHQFHVLKEEKQHIISSAATKISREQEKARMLEERLVEANNRLSNLSRVLEVKENLIEELTESESRSEARLEASEKFNASLKYELCMLQKELEIRNKEREFNLKSADAAQKRHLQSIKRITKLETECQRLRVMVQKRLPGPAAIARMRTEVEMVNGATEMRTKKSNSTMEVASLIERLHAIEDENKIIKETLTKKTSELQSLRVMFARTASKLSQAETQLGGSPRGHACLELARSSPVSYDFPLGSISEEGCDEDSTSCTESWASALISELEHFKPGKPVTTLDLSLMDDFIEMEKLAIVCVDKPFDNLSTISRGSSRCSSRKEIYSMLDSSEATGMEVVPMDSCSVTTEANNGIQMANDTGTKIEKSNPSESKLREETKRLEHEILKMESMKTNLEGRLESLIAKNKSLASDLEESKERIANLQDELSTLKETKGLIEDQIENQKLINKDLCLKLDEYHQKFSNLEVELEDKSNCCDELEATCLELQLQLESASTERTPKYNMEQEQKQLRTDWEISAASEKLAECQETILTLGKQLKALASPRDAALFDKMVPNPDSTRIHRRPQLRDHMRGEDNAETEDTGSPKTKEIMCSPDLKKPNAGLLYGQKLLTSNGADNSVKTVTEPSPVKSPESNVGALVLLPKKSKGGASFLGKLLLRRKKIVRI